MKNTDNNEEMKTIKINNSHKIGFFKRIKNAIFKLENYGEFILEKTGVSIAYFLKLILLVSIITAAVSTYNFNIIVSKGFNYVKNELPNFNYSDGKVIFDKDIEAYDEELDFYAIFNTKSELSDGVQEELKSKVKDYELSIIFLKDKIILTEYGQAIEYKYTELAKQYNLTTFSKEELVETLNSIGLSGINITYFAVSLLSMYIVNVITVSLDVLLVFLFGLIISKLCGVNMPSSKVLALAIHALTLSILLSTAYSVVYSITGFYIEYFDIMYLMVAYVYLVAAILIIKADVIKQRMELQKIIEVQKEVKKELDEKREDENKEENKKDNNDKKKEKDEEEEDPIVNREPDGSEI